MNWLKHYMKHTWVCYEIWSSLQVDETVQSEERIGRRYARRKNRFDLRRRECIENLFLKDKPLTQHLIWRQWLRAWMCPACILCEWQLDFASGQCSNIHNYYKRPFSPKIESPLWNTRFIHPIWILYSPRSRKTLKIINRVHDRN